MRWKPAQSVCIVTGASSGIGRALCRLLAQQEAIVIAVARRRERLDQLVSEFSPTVIHPVAGDITDPAVRENIGTKAASLRGGALDLLVNNAGIGAIGPFAEATPERLRQIMEVNFFAPAELTRSLLPNLRQGNASVICNIGSVLGHCAVPDKSEYCASKFAMHGFSDALRVELAGDGIQVTLVSPSTTKSEFFDSLVDTDANNSSKSIGSWPPERVAKATLAAIKARRSEVICSVGGKALVYADRLSPPLMNRILRK
ncbi:SDR family NAD(P)-dependent oxidoreductase [Planctomycetes bacterium K23_9]|uniref:3-oxoacyl-[acyl-carrier-protein] reductase FabG n=1 Tax=Stieleria marina TaxID=1930275 RepID=A0A517NTV7_9BACT|nr:3-oxoacyl-[acyl-carrier-protein] reductase FabG [Planctomycetes bacterium K23_9]